MRLDRPPFRLDPAQSPASVAVDLVNAFSELTTVPGCTATVFGRSMAALGMAPDSAVAMAGARLAADIDSGGGGGHPHPYHNTRHFCEVMLCAHFIGSLEALPAVATAEVVLAALMHDYGHDGRPNGTPFRLERRSVTMADAVIGPDVLDDPTRRRVQALVLATDVNDGHRFVLACHAARSQAAAGVPRLALPTEAPELGLFAADPLATRQALVLCEADVLPSVGLTFGHALKMQAELSAEWDTVLDAQDKLRFVEEWFRRVVTSAFFKPNVESLKRRLAWIAVTA